MLSTPDRAIDHDPIVLTFHKLSATLSWGSTNFSPRRFVALLNLLDERNYDLGRNGTERGRRRILITFDDGYQHLSETLPPVIEQFGIRPLVFIPTDWLGQSNSWDYSYFLRKDPHLNGGEVRALAALGVAFGSHGRSHQDLRFVPQGRLESELVNSRRCLEDILGQPVARISYPFGGVNQRVLETAASAGYEFGYTMRFPRLEDPPLARGRLAVYGFDTHFSILQKVQRGPLYPLEQAKARITNGLSGGTRLLNRLRGAV